MFLVTVLVLGRYLARSVLVVAYIFSLARPWPGINRRRSLFPRFRSRVSAFSRLKLTSVTNSQPCRWSHAGPTRIASLRLAPLSHSHTHTLSLSLSQRQWDNNHTHRPSSSPARVLISGTSLGLFDLITLSNARGLQLRNTVPLKDALIVTEAVYVEGSHPMPPYFVYFPVSDG